MDARALDGLMRDVAGRQHGLVARYQLPVHRHQLARRVRSTDWERVTNRLLRLVGAPESDRQRGMAAVLDAGPGAVLSHRSAAALWDLPGFGWEPLHASRLRSSRGPASPLARVHRPLLLPSRHCTTREGIPVTTLVRTLFDLAGTEHPARTELALHAALRLGLRWAAIEEHLYEVAEHGRPGIQVMRELMAEHHGQHTVGSGLEARFIRVLKRAGLPEPRRQVDLGDNRGWIGRVDFLYDDDRLVIEVDGDHYHSSPLDVERDKRRTAELVAAGYAVLPVSERLLRKHPEQVAQLVRSARRRSA